AWWWGLPTSSSHALIGGYAGGAMARAALQDQMHSIFAVIIPQGWYKTLIFIVVAPVIGLVLGFLFMLSVYWIFRRSASPPVDRLFRRLQLLSAAAHSLGHGANDAQKTMGIIAGAHYTGGVMSKSDMLATWRHAHWPII